ncbi:FAD-binding oxidoreductase [Homoserinimonas aerilata]|nr:FAD-binding oxidoreductase [Homoserinimonas aerilata]
MPANPPALSPDLVAALASRVSGPVLTPSDEGFAQEVAGFNLAIPLIPDVAVGANSQADVVEAVRFAAANSLPLRIHATGHGTHHPISDGVLLVTRRLNAVSVDPETRIASIGAGANWADVTAAAAPHGLTGIPGSSVTVGAVGYILGGGLGPLARSHGVSSDWVRGFTVVTASGDVVEANAAEHPDLFWALRGGKGGLGVVTEMRLELVPLESVYAGSLFFAEEHIEAALRGWIEWSSSADDSVTTSVAVVNFPAFEAVPEPLRGRRVLTLRFAHPGDEAEGRRLAAPLRALAPALIDAIGVLPTSQLRLIHNDPDEPGNGWSAGALLNDLDQAFADALLAAVGPGTNSPVIAVEIRHMGAAAAHDVAGGSAVGGRDSGFTLSVIGVPDPSLFDSVLPAFHAGLLASLDEWVSPETTINFAGDPHDRESFESAWPPLIFERLDAVRRLYDPSGLFTYGPPAG